MLTFLYAWLYYAIDIYLSIVYTAGTKEQASAASLSICPLSYMHAAVTFCLMLIKFVSLTSQSITKFVNTDVQRRVSVYFGGNIFNIKLTIVAAQKLYTMHTRNENHALDSRTSWLHCACKKRERKKEKEGAQAA